MLKAGDLRHRVTIERLTSSQNTSTGDVTESWVTFATVWAAIAPLSARDFVAAQAAQSKVSARLTIRALPGVTAAMRAVHGSTIYYIEGVLPDPDSGLEYLTLPVSQGVRAS